MTGETHETVQTTQSPEAAPPPRRGGVRKRYRELVARASAMNHTLELLVVAGKVIDATPLTITVMRMPSSSGEDGDLDAVLDGVEAYLESPVALMLDDLHTERRLLHARLEREARERDDLIARHDATTARLAEVERAIDPVASEQPRDGTAESFEDFEAFVRATLGRDVATPRRRR